jgi:hypothetical protein
MHMKSHHDQVLFQDENFDDTKSGKSRNMHEARDSDQPSRRLSKHNKTMAKKEVHGEMGPTRA